MTQVTQLTVESVTNPSQVNFGEGILGQALKQQAERAGENYVEFAAQILGRVQRERACLQQTKVDLEARLAAIAAAEAKIDKAMGLSTGPKGLFPLAATVNMKEEAISFARSNSLVVPASSDDVWKVE